MAHICLGDCHPGPRAIAAIDVGLPLFPGDPRHATALCGPGNIEIKDLPQGLVLAHPDHDSGRDVGAGQGGVTLRRCASSKAARAEVRAARAPSRAGQGGGRHGPRQAMRVAEVDRRLPPQTKKGRDPFESRPSVFVARAPPPRSTALSFVWFISSSRKTRRYQSPHRSSCSWAPQPSPRPSCCPRSRSR